MQRRLGAAGCSPDGAVPALFCDITESSVSHFQTSRGLDPTGLCDEQTWAVLVEAGWALGDRLLHLDAPQQRGDDVTDLQASLNRLGFDCGRPDGIMGSLTARALTDFQRHAGLPSDGVCGVNTIRLLRLLARQTGSGPGVAQMREELILDNCASLESARLVVGQFGGLSSLTRLVVRELRHRGATVISTDEHDAAAQAAAANRFGATAYVGFEAKLDIPTRIAYFGVPSFESLGGRRLAECVRDAFELDRLNNPLPSEPDDFGDWGEEPVAPKRSLDATGPIPLPELIQVVGMRLPVLRETRMPAVLCSFGSVREAVDTAPSIATAIAEAATEWISAPSEHGDHR